ncbi:MAG: phosphatase domain-containing protein [Desulfosarcina sp.]
MISIHPHRSFFKLLAEPFRRQSSRTVVIRAYRGFGSTHEICLFGRIFRQPERSGRSARDDLLGDLANIWRWIRRRGMRYAEVEARFGLARKRARTDRHGFFFIRLPIQDPPDSNRIWQQAHLKLAGPGGGGSGTAADVFIAPRSAAFGMISDIDDTVVYTGVANRIKMLWRLFFSTAQSRVAFAGVAAFYRALHRGGSGGQSNPMLYVSRAPWSIYDVMDAFFNLHDIPAGPVLFLRYWGMTIDHPLPRRARDHKLALIRQALDLYRDLPFILIGDSGQKDPEVYARIVRENPGRILAIYIRDVGSAPGRRRSIAKLAQAVAPTGTTLLLAADSAAMAEHAVRQGFITSDAATQVRSALRAGMGKT